MAENPWHPGVDTGCCQTGACCVVLSLPLDADEIHAQRFDLTDGEQIDAMIEPLTLNQAEGRCRQFGVDPALSLKPGHHYFMCKNWDEDTRLCTIYEDAPAMCSKFPYDEACRHSDCACTNGEPYEDGETQW